MTGAWGLERGALWALDLPLPGAARAPRVAARFDWVGPADSATMAAAMEVPEAEVVSRLARGSRALAAWHREDVASYCWVSTRREHVGELGLHLALPAGESYVWDCATVPAFRGHGLYTSLLRAIADALAAEGQRRVWIGATSTNQASNRTFAAVGFRAAAAVVAVRLAGHGIIVRLRGAPGADRELASAARRVLTGRE